LIRVCFVFQSLEILTLLRERQDCVVIRARPGEPLPDADLFIWDFEPGTAIPSTLIGLEDRRHLVLVDAKHLHCLSPSLQKSLCVLLKPVNPFTLNTFVDLAIEAWRSRQLADDAGALRLDREALLNYVIEVNLKLQEYDQERTNFLARALHDFRSPLTALHGYCGLLAEEKLGVINSEQRDLLQRMQRSTNRLARLASSTFELTISGQLQRTPAFANNEIEETVRQALHDVDSFLRDKRIEVQVNLDPPGHPLCFESEQIQQLLVNLLENACRFTPIRGMITVRGASVSWLRNPGQPGYAIDTASEKNVNAYQIDVLDSGPGVEPAVADKIFEQYTSYAGSDDRASGGLGLAICKLIAGAHHGAIWATPGKTGGQFSFILPFDQPGVGNTLTTEQPTSIGAYA
jgi:signal transduction histidine kinase